MTLPSAYPEWNTIGELLSCRAADRPDELAVEVAGRSLSYAQLNLQSERVGANLAAFGVEKGQRVASFAFNSVEQLLVWFGCMKIGAVWVPLNVSLVGADLLYSLNDAEPAIVVVEGETRPHVDELYRESPPRFRIFEIGAEGQDAFELLLNPVAVLPNIDIAGSDPAVIMYTGGTTGMPKGVELPQLAWIAAGYRYCEAFEVVPDDVHYSVLALFHNGGLMIGVIGPLVAGIPTHLERWFSVSKFWDRVRTTNATIIDPIGTMVTLLCQQSASPDDRNHRVRVSVGVLSQVPPEIASTFRSRFGLKIVNVYSLSEAGGVLIVHNKADSPKPEANGKGWGWCDIRIVDREDNPLQPGERGEICLRPARPFTFMLGYFNQPSKTVECLRNLWLHTGDIGYLDEDGYLFFTGRQSHWLRTRGENVSAYEVENTLSRFPGIEEVIVVGVSAALGEEEVKAFVIVKPNHTVDPEELFKWCSGQLASFKWPRYIQFVSEFPRSAAKREVERHKLRDLGNDTAWDADSVFGRRSARTPTTKSP